jgi:hypothetical protein
MGDKGGGKKDKIVISILSHALYDSLQTHCTTGSQGRLAKFGGQEILAGVIICTNRKKTMRPFPLWW